MTHGKPVTSTSLALAVRLSGEPRFIDIARALVVRMAEQVGHPSASAEGVGRAVQAAIESVLEHAYGGDFAREIVLDFTADPHAVEAWIRCPLDRGVIEAALRSPAGGGSAYDRMHATVNRIEFGQHEGVSFCRIRHETAAH